MGKHKPYIVDVQKKTQFSRIPLLPDNHETRVYAFLLYGNVWGNTPEEDLEEDSVRFR